MGLLNYSTTISVDKTLAQLQDVLRRQGAKSILINYDKGQSVAVSFQIPTAWGDRAFRLPANIEAVYTVMLRQAQARQIERRFATREQAARVGWRVILEWTKAQLAIIETEMVTLHEVFLPYLIDDRGHTLREVMAERRLALPPGGESE